MPTVTITAVNYDVYADVATADSYLAADIKYSAIWSAASADTKASALVSATRNIDAQTWQGAKTVSSQALDWPRSGITDVESATVPQEVIDASILLAAMAVDDADALQSANNEDNVKRSKAGSAEVEFFRKTSTAVTIFPATVQPLIGKWLSVGNVNAGISSGFTGTSNFTDCPYDINGIR